MSTLSLQLAGPLQSWGSASRFTRRTTDDAPTKSGIIGLLAAASGRRRTDSIEDLVDIRLGVRIDVPGEILRDYHTAWVPSRRVTQLSTRYYLADAVFLVVIQGGDGLIEGIADALAHPVFPLSLGRRSCVPARRLVLGTRSDDLEKVIADAEWLGSASRRNRTRGSEVVLETVVDCEPGTPRSEVRRDVPVSFDPTRREYGWRSVLRSTVTVPSGRPSPPPDAIDHDPLALVNEAR